MVLNAHAGTKYGIPFPVYCRASFGLRGANVPALLRALVACGWFGIQTWIGGEAIYMLLGVFFPAWKTLPAGVSRLSMPPQLGCFFAFWLINMVVIYKGIESIRILLNIKAPLLIILGLALLAWAYYARGRLWRDAVEAVAVRPRRPEGGEVLAAFSCWRSRPTSASGRRWRSTFPTSAATPGRSAIRSSARPRAADDDGPVLVHRRGGHVRGARHLQGQSRRRPAETVGSRVSAVAIREPGWCWWWRWRRCASPRWPPTSPPTS